LKNILKAENLKYSSTSDELNKKKILCKIISLIFIKIYIIIKSINETFNNYKSLIINNEEEPIDDLIDEFNDEQTNEQTGEKRGANEGILIKYIANEILP
jgi:hypothetical protein